MTLQDCNLVVLSACESGIGKLGDDGVFGLQRGFKNAGVKTLLVSLNEVADEASASMMIAFYKYYMSGNGITQKEALGMAQKDIRQQYTNDNTWASFILIDSFN
jgi:CHAT domain-containing protein